MISMNLSNITINSLNFNICKRFLVKLMMKVS